MASVKVPPEHQPIFAAALPKDPRVQTLKMFGGVVAKVNGYVFAGLFARSVMVWLQEPDRSTALSLQGAAPFDPMGNGRARSSKVMLPDGIMAQPAQLRRWVRLAFEGAASLPPKVSKARRK